MLSFTCQTQIALEPPDEQRGFVTWFDARVSDPDSKVEICRVRVARIFGGEAMNRGAPMVEILDADSEELVDLHDVFFDGDTLKETYETATGKTASISPRSSSTRRGVAG